MDRDVLVVYNPTKAHQPNHIRFTKELTNLIPGVLDSVEFIPTQRDCNQTILAIQEAAWAGRIVIANGGDATANVVGHANMLLPQEERFIVKPAFGGTKNDYAYNRLGRLHSRYSLEDFFANAVVEEVHPIEITVTPPDATSPTDTERYFILNTGGFGATGKGARYLNQPEHRNYWLRNMPLVGTLMSDLKFMRYVLSDISTFTSYENGVEPAAERVDRSLVNGEIAGGRGRYNMDHLQKEFLDITTSEPTKQAVIKSAVLMALRRNNGIRRTELRFTTGDQIVRGHVDGEPFDIAPGSLVTAAIATTFIPTLSAPRDH